MIPISQIDSELKIYKDNTLVLWGCGELGSKFFTMLRPFGVLPDYFCDNDENKWGGTYLDVPVISPTELKDLQQKQGAKLLVQITVGLKIAETIKKQMETLGINKVISYVEGYQMLRFYLQCKKYKENPQYLKKRQTLFTKHPYRNMPNLISYELTILDQIELLYLCNKEKSGIMISMISKTGDSTLKSTLQKLNFPCVQNHFTVYINHYSEQKQKIRVITAVRDPISRDISELFQEISLLGMRYFNSEVYDNNQADAQFIFDSLSKNEKTFTPSIEKWFSSFGEYAVNVLNHPFDHEKGYTIIKEGNFDIFFYQLEKLNDIIPELSNWVGVPFAKLENANMAEDKWIAKSYKQAQKELKFSPKYFDTCYNDPYIQHCYSQEDIEKFKTRWRSNIDPNK